MNKALKKGAIEVSEDIIRQNRLFDVPKKDTEERRVILDLKKLNLFIGCETFKMTTVAQVRKILPKGGWAVSIDLKDAYWHVPVAQKFRKFLGFKLGEESYRFKVMPFGLNIAPRMFTKLVNVVIKCLRQKNVLVVNYLDDWLVWGQTKVECEKAMKETLLEIEKRGFIVNVEKSNLIPSQDFQWLGIQWNLKEATLTIPNQTRRKASNAVRTFLKKKKVTRRFLEKLMGLLQFCSITDPWLKVKLKDINKFWLKSACNRLRDKSHMLRLKQKVALSPWNKMKAFRRKTKLHPGPVTHIVHTDASKWGWGGHSDVQTTFGKWSAVMSKCHINFLELRAADLVLRKFNPPRGSHIKLVMDNSTAVACITRGGEQVDISERCDEVDSEVVNQEGLEFVCSSPQWHSKCSSRLIVTSGSSSYGMEIGSNLISPSDESQSQTSDRSIRNKQKPSASDVCVSSPREASSSTECVPVELEQLAIDLSLSSDSLDFEGFESSGVVQRGGIPHSSSVAQQSVVSSVDEEGETQNSLKECYIVPSSERKNLLRIILTEPGPSYMGFLKEIYRYTTSDEEVLERLVRGIKDSTNAQYHSTWKKFVQFLQQEKPRIINADIVMRFLNKEFKEGKQSSTLASYKSALRPPLMLGFGFHMEHTVIQTLSKNFALERPKTKGKVINWKLTDILDLLSSDEFNNHNISMDNCLQKTMFLIALVSGYRADEVFAFHRGGAYIVRHNNGYTLHPIEGFTSKNETDTNQREPLSFKELTENEKLCPVKSLDKYLEMTAQYKTGRLFRNSRVGSSLSRKSYTSVLSALAEKASGIRKISMTVHHIRSVATSYAAARGATHAEIATFTGWRSTRVFEDHYVTHIEAPKHIFMACGRVIRPDPESLPI